jgi:hypothetical protein
MFKYQFWWQVDFSSEHHFVWRHSSMSIYWWSYGTSKLGEVFISVSLWLCHETSNGIHQSAVVSFNLSIGRRSVKRCSGFVDMEKVTYRLKQLALKVSTLVSMYGERTSKASKELIYCSLGGGFRCLWRKRDYFTPFCKLVHHYQNVGVPSWCFR